MTFNLNKVSLFTLLVFLFTCQTKNENTMEQHTMTPTYTFMSVSTAKPGKLKDLIRIAKAPTLKMDKKSNGLIAYQVSVDEERNSVVVWATYDRKETLYDFLQTEEGKQDHGENEDMDSIIDTFVMYDLSPVSGRLEAKKL